MAVNTTVEVVMPAMGESVSDGTILEWHKQEGDEVSEDETLVEISTDKVDAEVPAPLSGTVVKIHAAEGDTVDVGSVLAEIAPPTAPRPRRRPSPSRGRAEAPAEQKTIDITMPAMGESVSEGTILEWSKEVGDSVEEDERIVEISTDKVDAEMPSPAAGTITEILAGPGDTVEVGQVIARMSAGAGAPAKKATPAPEPTIRPAPRRRRAGGARGQQGHARRPARRRRPGRRPQRRHGQRPRRAHRQGRRAGRRQRRHEGGRRPHRTNGKPEGATLLKGAGAMLARYMDESRSIPTATSFRTITVTSLDGRRKQLKEAGQKVSFTHLIAYAIARAATEQMPVMARAFAEIDGKPHVVDVGQVNLGIAVDVNKKDGGRTLMVPVIRDAGRLTFPQFLDAFNELIARRARTSSPPTTSRAPTSPSPTRAASARSPPSRG